MKEVYAMNETACPKLIRDEFIARLSARKIEIERILASLENALKNAPEGGLRIGRNRLCRQYYHRYLPSDKEGKYLKQAQLPLAKALAQKDYNAKLANVLRHELKTTNTFLESYHPERIDEIYLSLNENRKPLVTPIRLCDADYIKQWESVSYDKKGFDENAPEFYTAKGERVRSKSEIMIADTLNRLGIPYRYEYPIHIPGIGMIHVDFFCLNIRTRKELPWEHFGMMSDPTYADQTVNKLEKYINAGYFPGSKLIITFETSSRPLSSRVIILTIKEYLL